MALPGNISTVTVTGTWLKPDGAACTGNVTFTPSTRLQDPTGPAIIVPATISADLVAGAISVVLPVTDDPQVSPTFTYHVKENIEAGAFVEEYEITLPTAGGSVDLAEVGTTPLGPLGAGLRAGPGLVGFLGNPSTLTVLNIGDDVSGIAGASWDGPALRIGANNVSLDGYLINAGVEVQATNFTIENSIVNAADTAFWGIHVAHGDLTITDCTVTGPGAADGGTGSAVLISDEGRVLATRCDLSGMEDGVDCLNASVISQCYIHNLDTSSDAHIDGLNYFGGTGLVVEHCYIDVSDVATGVPAGVDVGINSSIQLNELVGPDTVDPIVNNNYMRGGVYYFRAEGHDSNLTFTNNNFGTVVDPAVAEVGVLTEVVGTWSNNRDSDGVLIPQP